MSGGFLKAPRVRVFWGTINLSAYDGPSKGAPEVFKTEGEKGGPIVYDVAISLPSEGAAPTGSFKWDPTGPGYEAYEWFISQPEYVQGRLSIEFFYPQGKRIVTMWRWSGQTINYGNDMSVTVNLQSELAGLVNATLRNTAQAYDGGVQIEKVYKKFIAQYGMPKEILSFNKTAEEQMKKVWLLNVYGNDQTFGAAISNLAKQAGHQVTANNIGSSKLIVFPPVAGSGEEILNGVTDIGAGSSPEPEKRYGYILGPSLINTVSRKYNWRPPQQDNAKTPSSQAKTEKTRDEKGRFISAQEVASKEAAQKTSSPIGTANARPNPGIRNKDNPEGPTRQLALNQEKGSELSFDTLMCPALVGIKPNDMVFIPSLTGDYIEDWIVQTADYKQNNGDVSINIRATRTFGVKDSMNEKASKKFLDFAKQNKLVGPGAALAAWDAYAWSLPGG